MLDRGHEWMLHVLNDLRAYMVKEGMDGPKADLDVLKESLERDLGLDVRKFEHVTTRMN